MAKTAKTRSEIEKTKQEAVDQIVGEKYWKGLDGHMQIVTATGQQGHNSGPARDTIAGQKLS